MNTNKIPDKEQHERFKVYKDEKENKCVIEDTVTANVLTFSEGKVKTEGYFASFKDGKVMTNTRLVGQTIREMDDYLHKKYKHLLYGTRKKQ